MRAVYKVNFMIIFNLQADRLLPLNEPIVAIKIKVLSAQHHKV